ncbi:N-acetyltransferase family protein [Desulfolithobacter sp.]
MISYRIYHRPYPARPEPILPWWPGHGRPGQWSRTRPIIVARINNDVIGYLRLSSRHPSKTWTIRGLAVHRSWQGRGIGGRLLRLAIRYTGEHCQGRQLFSFVRPDNNISMHLHLGLGFTPVSRPPTWHGPGRPQPSAANSERLHTCLHLYLPAACSRYSSST